MSGAVVLLTGRSFAGTTTLAAELVKALPADLLSFDAINEERGLHGGAGIPTEEWARTKETAQTRVRAALRSARTVVVDDTSSPRFLRDECGLRQRRPARASYSSTSTPPPARSGGAASRTVGPGTVGGPSAAGHQPAVESN